MTRSCAKLGGFKPVSAIPVKPTSIRRPRAKKIKMSVNVEADDRAPQLPPPTPIRAMQELGASLGIAPDKMTVENLMASPKPVDQDDVSNDE